MPVQRPLSRAIVGFVCLTVLLGLSQVAEACPSCQAALADGSQGNLAAGIYYSILFMMSMPFAIVGIFGGFAYRAVKREQRRIAEANAKREADESSSSAERR
jgi:p-aminobenzoyl-glutamate transporter AbgT